MTTLSAKPRGRGRETRWTRAVIIEKIREWVALYGEPPRAADWNPSSARWSGQTWRIERYRAGDWPPLNAAKRPFGGSLNAAIVAAGFEPNKSGPPSYRKAANPELLDSHLDAHPLVRQSVDALRAEVEKLTERVAARDRQLAEAKRVRDGLKEQLRASRAARKVVTKTKTKTKVKVVKERDLASLRAAKSETKEARTAATRMASRLERAEATITELRETIRGLKAEALRQSRRAFLAEERADQLAAQTSEVREVEVVREVPKIVEKVVELPAPEQATVDAALRDAMLARRESEAAVARAERADRAYMELAAAVAGEPRRLTPGELDELRSRGPAGPAVLAAAIKDLARARAGRGSLAVALTKVASAALSWRDRL